MTNGRTEDKPAIVPRTLCGASQDGKIRDRWSWVEPNVWTDRMLTALERGVKGGKWHSLIDKVYSLGRSCGRPLQSVIFDLNRTLPGWFEYFKHSLWSTFRPLDGWIRMRLRSILRRRHRGRGRGCGLDHIRWLNAFFADRGLFSFCAAHASACQPRRG